jgi:cysteine desulfurase
MTTYLDCNATTPIEPDVAEIMWGFLVENYGNPGSRTHEFGNAAKIAVENAREQIACVVETDKSDVTFTSGATEANNLALIGMKEYLLESKKTVIASQIEHMAVLEPLAHLEKAGVKVKYLAPNKDGIIEPNDLEALLFDNVGLVSLMHINNETGAIQPIEKYADILARTNAYFHVDAAQGFGKDIEQLRHDRVDMISCSGHKIHGPKGIGALITRRRRYKRPPITPLLLGGGQERNLRAGTLPTHQIAGFGLAAELALSEANKRNLCCLKIKEEAIAAFDRLSPVYNGLKYSAAHTLNLSIRGVNSEAAIVALKGVAALSNGSACTSSSYTHSHVLKAMKVDDEVLEGALRFSWCHMTGKVDWELIVKKLSELT